MAGAFPTMASRELRQGSTRWGGIQAVPTAPPRARRAALPSDGLVSWWFKTPYLELGSVLPSRRLTEYRQTGGTLDAGVAQRHHAIASAVEGSRRSRRLPPAAAPECPLCVLVSWWSASVAPERPRFRSPPVCAPPLRSCARRRYTSRPERRGGRHGARVRAVPDPGRGAAHHVHSRRARGVDPGGGLQPLPAALRAGPDRPRDRLRRLGAVGNPVGRHARLRRVLLGLALVPPLRRGRALAHRTPPRHPLPPGPRSRAPAVRRRGATRPGRARQHPVRNHPRQRRGRRRRGPRPPDRGQPRSLRPLPLQGQHRPRRARGRASTSSDASASPSWC